MCPAWLFSFILACLLQIRPDHLGKRCWVIWPRMGIYQWLWHQSAWHLGSQRTGRKSMSQFPQVMRFAHCFTRANMNVLAALMINVNSPLPTFHPFIGSLLGCSMAWFVSSLSRFVLLLAWACSLLDRENIIAWTGFHWSVYSQPQCNFEMVHVISHIDATAFEIPSERSKSCKNKVVARACLSSSDLPIWSNMH